MPLWIPNTFFNGLFAYFVSMSWSRMTRRTPGRMGRPGRRSSLDSVWGPTSRMPLRWRHGCNERTPCFQTRRLKNAGADSYNGFGWQHPVAAGCVGSGLAAVTWLLLYFGLRRKHPAFLALKQVLGSSPMPNCLQLVRDLADEKLGPGPLGPWRNLQLMVKMEDSLRKEKGGARRSLMVLAQLETLILDALASIRCNELFQGFIMARNSKGCASGTFRKHNFPMKISWKSWTVEPDCWRCCWEHPHAPTPSIPRLRELMEGS